MDLPLPLTRDLVLIGGGHAHALVLRMWGMSPLAGARLTLVTPQPTAPYTGMLPGFVAGHYGREDVAIDMVRLARFSGARIILDHARSLDASNRMIELASGRQLRFDAASINIGIHTQLFDIAGFSDHGVAVKPMDNFSRSWVNFKARVLAGLTRPEVAIIGGGIGGAEIAMAVAYALRDAKGRKVTLIDQAEVLGQEHPALAAPIHKHLDDLGVERREDTQVASVHADHITFSDGQTLASQFTIGSAGAKAHSWLADAGIADPQSGFIDINNKLQSTVSEKIFASGDCANMPFAPRPKAGVFAVRAAPILFHNLRASLTGATMKSFAPQKDYLKLVSLGSKTATAEKWGVAPTGATMWRWKDRIDRKFMDQFLALTPMAPPTLPREHTIGMAEALGPKPLCGGCGAKIPASVLDDILPAHAGATRPEVLAGPGDDAAILKQSGKSNQVITTDHLRAFVADPVLMARIAANHALGDIWAMGATPQSAVITLILPPMSLPIQQNTVSEIMQTLSDSMQKAGAAIIGGHSSTGAELTIGLTLTGLCKNPITLAGAQTGDALILTKPIGSGTILAAEMQLSAQGADVLACHDLLCQSQAKASTILASHAHAMTDVTGFGLIGHATQMARRSQVAIQIDLGTVPIMQGAENLAAAGTRSSLFDDNVAIAPHLLAANDPRSVLLFDPQTAGGLLAAIPAKVADKTLAELRAAGYPQAAVIGKVTSGQPGTVSI